MKRFFSLTAICSWLFTANLAGAEFVPNLKFGKPTPEEMGMTSYGADAEANAVVLCHLKDVYYSYTGQGLLLVSSVKTRIKVLKPEGKDAANVQFTYYRKDNGGIKEEIDINATSYNLENGKVVKTKMKKEFIHEEQLNPTIRLVKFVIPQVNEGTVLEYEYTIKSSFLYDIDDWSPQQYIPVAYCKYELTIPDFYKFNVENRGAGLLSQRNEASKLLFSNASTSEKCNAAKYIFEGYELPAIRKEAMVWNVDDFCPKITCELMRTEIPGQTFQNFNTTWERVAEALISESDFGGRFKGKSPYKNELLARQIEQIENKHERACEVIKFLRDHLKWNNAVRFAPKSASTIVKEGVGSNADLNAILINMLHDVGLKSYPVVLRTRDKGILPITYPSSRKLNTFIVAILFDDDTFGFFDTSALQTGYINVFPEKFYTERALIIKDNKLTQWVNLQDFAHSACNTKINATLTPEGLVKGGMQIFHKGIDALSYRRDFKEAIDSAAFVDKIAKGNELDVIEYNVANKNKFSDGVTEQIQFEKEVTSSADLIYLPSLLVKVMHENLFKEKERMFPVEFPHQHNENLQILIHIPDGWKVEEKPEDISMTLENKGISAKFLSVVNDQNITIQMRLIIKKTFFSTSEYGDLKAIFDQIDNLSKNMFILKRK